MAVSCKLSVNRLAVSCKLPVSPVSSLQIPESCLGAAWKLPGAAWKLPGAAWTLPVTSAATQHASFLIAVCTCFCENYMINSIRSYSDSYNQMFTNEFEKRPGVAAGPEFMILSGHVRICHMLPISAGTAAYGLCACCNQQDFCAHKRMKRLCIMQYYAASLCNL